MRALVPLVVVLFMCAAQSAAAQTPSQHEHAGAPPERLGTVHFATSCAPAVSGDFDRAVALLHSFWFRAAIDAFTAVTAKDPACGMAYWGDRAQPVGQPVWWLPLAAGAGGGSRCRGEGPGGGATVTPGTGISHGGCRTLSRLRDGRSAHAGTRVRQAQMGALSKANAERHRGRDLPCPRAHADGLAERQDVQEPAGRRRDSRAALQDPAPPSGHRALPDSQLRRPGAWRPRRSTRNALREDRALGAARTAYALAHVHEGRALAGLHRHQPGVGRAAQRDKSVSEELHAKDYQVYAYLQTGQDRGRPRRDRGVARPRDAGRGRPCQRGAAGGRVLCARGHSRALRAGAGRLGRSGGPDASRHALCVP